MSAVVEVVGRDDAEGQGQLFRLLRCSGECERQSTMGRSGRGGRVLLLPISARAAASLSMILRLFRLLPVDDGAIPAAIGSRAARFGLG